MTALLQEYARLDTAPADGVAWSAFFALHPDPNRPDPNRA